MTDPKSPTFAIAAANVSGFSLGPASKSEGNVSATEISPPSFISRGKDTAPLLVERNHVVRNVAHVGFAKALAAQKPKLWTRAMAKLYLYLLIAALNSMMNGYAVSIMGGIRSIETYNV